MNPQYLTNNAMSRLPSVGCGLFGALFGLLLIPAGFYLAYYGEARLVNHGKVFEAVAMMTPEAALAAGTSPVKLRGKPEAEFDTVERYEGRVVHYRLTVEEYERETDSDGEVSYEWNTKETKTRFVPFKLGGIQVQPDRAKILGAERVFQGIKPVDNPRLDYDPQWAASHSDKVGDRRLTVEVIPADRELIVFGDLSGSTISGGNTFVISALDEATTTQRLKTEFTVFYWLIKVGSVLMIAIGFMLLFSPLLNLLGWIPVVGAGLKAAIFGVGLVLGIIGVLMLTALVKYFWVVVILLAVVIVLGAVLGTRAIRARRGTKAAV